MKMKLKTKTVMLLIIVSLILTLGSVVISYTMYTNTMLSKYKSIAVDITKTEDLLLRNYDIEGMMKKTLDILDEYCEEKGGLPDFDTMSEAEIEDYYKRYEVITSNDEYQKLLKDLQDMTKANDALSIYAGAIDLKHGTGIYFADGADPNETEVCPCGYLGAIEDANLVEFVNKTYEFDTVDTNYPEFGWLCTATTAMLSDSNELIGVAQADISLNQIRIDRIMFLIRLVCIMVLFAVLLTIIAAYITNKSMVMPLKKLSEATSTFVSQRHDEETIELENIEIKTGDEIEELRNSFVNMSHELTGYISDIMKITAEKEKLGVELELATKIQATYLPCIFPAFPERNEFDIYATMAPAKEVGGDFYDFFMIDNDHLGLVMADVSGKGVPAALFMMISKTLIKSFSQAGKTKVPSEILAHVNDQLCENNEAGMFVTVWLGILTISTGELITANAGHEYPAIRRKDGVFELVKDKHGLPLASIEGVPYVDYETKLNPGDLLFVYTDGVAEATNAENELFGTDRMLESLNSLGEYGEEVCSNLLVKVRQDIDGFVKEAPQFDDITMLAFKYEGSN